MYVGVYERQLDERGRVALPSSYRPTPGTPGDSDPWYVSLGLDKCVQVTDATTFRELAAEIVADVKAGTATRARQRAFAGSVEMVALDKQGRLTIPSGLLHHAGIEPKSAVSVAGVLDRIEIWATDRWENQDTIGRDEMGEVAM